MSQAEKNSSADICYKSFEIDHYSKVIGYPSVCSFITKKTEELIELIFCSLGMNVLIQPNPKYKHFPPLLHNVCAVML